MGADESVVQLPFIAGVLQAAFGSVIGVIILRMVFAFLRSEFSRALSFEGFAIELSFLSPVVITLVMIVSMMLGGVASFLAIGDVAEEERKYLR